MVLLATARALSMWVRVNEGIEGVAKEGARCDECCVKDYPRRHGRSERECLPIPAKHAAKSFVKNGCS